MAEKTQFLVEPGSRSIVMKRTFDAPRALVYAAMTEPEHMKHWWGPRRLELVVCEIDLRVGGTYRFVQRDADGNLFPFKGEYLELDAPRRVVTTFIFDVDGIRDHPAVSTLELEEVAGGTKVTGTTVYDTVESRDAAVASGMESGARETWERLVEHLASMG